MAFVERINSVKANSSDKIWQARINNPDLNPADRDLIQRFLQGEVSKEKLLKRYSFLLEEQIKNYDGKVSLTNSSLVKRIDAFGWALDHLQTQGKIKEEVVPAGNKAFEKYLNPEDKVENWPENRGVAREKIFARIIDYQDKIQASIWGTPERVKLTREQTALQSLAVHKGLFTEENIGVNSLNQYISSFEHSAALYKIQCVAVSPEKTDDAEVRSQVREEIKNLYHVFLKYLFQPGSRLDSQRIDAFLTLLSGYIGVAGQLGIPKEEIEAIKNEVENKVPQPAFKPADLREINQKGSPVVVTPDTLPQPLIDLLRKIEMKPGYSYYQFVKDNVKYMILTPNLISRSTDGLTGSESPGGNAVTGLPIVQIDTYIEKPEAGYSHMPFLFRLIEVIIHETFHAYWGKRHLDNPKLLSSTIDEGLAYLAGLKACQKLLNYSPKLGEYSKNAMKDLEKEIKACEATIGGALQILGLNPEEALKDIDSSKFLAASLKGNYENDTDTYPTQTPFALARSYAIYLDMGQKERDTLAPIFEEIIKGKSLSSLDSKGKRLVHELSARIESRYGKMKYDEVIKELRGLYGYYVWKEYKPQEESDIKSARAQNKDLKNKEIADWQNQSRKSIKEPIQEVKSGKRDDLILDVLVQLHEDLKKK